MEKDLLLVAIFFFIVYPRVVANARETERTVCVCEREREREIEEGILPI